MITNVLLISAFVGLLCVAAVIDIKTRTVPPWIVLTLFALWALVALIQQDITATINQLLAALAIGAGMLLVAYLFERVTGYESIGGGDIKLLAVLGLYLGPEGTMVCLLIACVLAAGYALVLKRQTFPFVPAIGLGACGAIGMQALLLLV